MKTPRVSRLFSNVLAYVVALAFIIPTYILVNLAFRGAGESTSPLIPPQRPTLDNFVGAWTESTLASSILVSAGVTVISVLVVLILSSMAAYPLARSTSRLSMTAFFLFLIGLLLPFQLALLPLYTQMRDIGLLGNPIVLVIVYTGMNMPFAVFIITTFLRASVPPEYEEAARIDGCSNVQVFTRIVVPLLRPALGTAGLLVGVGVWNDFFTPLIYLSGSKLTTIPMAIYQFVGQYTTNWPLIFAGLLISMIPILIVYLIFQKYIIQGFAGGLKG